MAEIYLTGAVSDWDDPYAWQREVEDDFDEHEFTNPFFLNDHNFGDDEVYEHPEEVVEPALEKISEMDGVLLRYDDEANLMGAAMEVKEAYQQGIPVVIYNVSEGDKRVSPWLLHHTRYTTKKRDKALNCLLMYAGESAEDVVGF